MVPPHGEDSSAWAAATTNALGAITADPMTAGHKRCCQLLCSRGSADLLHLPDTPQRTRCYKALLAAYAVIDEPQAMQDAVNEAVVNIATLTLRSPKRDS
jgi:hypothetical protein